MKKFYILALAMCATQLSAQDFADDNDFEYTILSENTVELASLGSNKYVLDVLEVPETVENEGVTYTVVAIGDDAASVSGISQVVLPATVTKIGDGAFNFCWNLEEVVLSPETLSIGTEAFAYCSMLTDINLPATLQYVGARAFIDDYSIESVLTFSEGVVIEEEAFANVSSEEVVFLGEPASVGADAFVMDYLTTVTVYMTTLPAFDPISAFGDYRVADLQLIVPAGCSDLYWDDEKWGLFGDISEMAGGNPTSIAALSAQRQQGIFAIDGKRQQGLTRGFNIVAGSNKVVFVK